VGKERADEGERGDGRGEKDPHWLWLQVDKLMGGTALIARARKRKRPQRTIEKRTELDLPQSYLRGVSLRRSIENERKGGKREKRERKKDSGTEEREVRKNRVESFLSLSRARFKKRAATDKFRKGRPGEPAKLREQVRERACPPPEHKLREKTV